MPDNNQTTIEKRFRAAARVWAVFVIGMIIVDIWFYRWSGGTNEWEIQHQEAANAGQ